MSLWFAAAFLPSALLLLLLSVHLIVFDRRREQQQREREAQDERVRLRNEQLDALRQVSPSLTLFSHSHFSLSLTCCYYLPFCLNISHSNFIQLPAHRSTGLDPKAFRSKGL